jgi:hypothetical protein
MQTRSKSLSTGMLTGCITDSGGGGVLDGVKSYVEHALADDGVLVAGCKYHLPPKHTFAAEADLKEARKVGAGTGLTSPPPDLLPASPQGDVMSPPDKLLPSVGTYSGPDLATESSESSDDDVPRTQFIRGMNNKKKAAAGAHAECAGGDAGNNHGPSKACS